MKLSTSVLELPSRQRWAPRKAESILTDLEHIRSCRVVTGMHGRVTEIHVLASDAVPAKSLVRSIESALFAHFGRPVNRKQISIAQVRSKKARSVPAPAPSPVAPTPSVAPTNAAIQPSARPQEAGHGGRMVLLSHQVAGARGQQVAVRVLMEHKGRRYEGNATAADVKHARLQAAARATLDAVGAAARDELDAQGREPLSLALTGVSLVGGTAHSSVLVSVTATNGRDSTALVGVAAAQQHPDRAAILATLQATDRWVRGQLMRL